MCNLDVHNCTVLPIQLITCIKSSVYNTFYPASSFNQCRCLNDIDISHHQKKVSVALERERLHRHIVAASFTCVGQIPEYAQYLVEGNWPSCIRWSATLSSSTASSCRSWHRDPVQMTRDTPSLSGRKSRQRASRAASEGGAAARRPSEADVQREYEESKRQVGTWFAWSFSANLQSIQPDVETSNSLQRRII